MRNGTAVYGVSEQLQRPTMLVVQIGVSCHFKALGYMVTVFATLAHNSGPLDLSQTALADRDYQGRGGVLQWHQMGNYAPSSQTFCLVCFPILQ